MSISKKDIQLLIGFAGIAIAACVYFFIYQPTMEKIDKMQTENTQLSARVTELEALTQQRDFFVSQTDQNNALITEIFDKYPADVRIEDALSIGMNMEAVSPMTILKLDYGTPEEFYHPIAGNSADVVLGDTAATVSADAAPVDAAQTAVAVPVAYKEPITYGYVASYEEAKRGLEYLSGIDSRQVVSQFSMTFDSATGLLAGITNLDMYYITGTSKEYTAPVLPAVQTGTTNIFSTVAAPANTVQQADTVSSNATDTQN